MRPIYTVTITLILTAALTACHSTGKGARQTSLKPARESSIFTDRDANAVYAGMVDDCLSKPWLDEWTQATGEKPKVAVGTVATDPRERIDTANITTQIKEELINSRRVRIVADNAQIEQLVRARLDQQVFTRDEDIVRMANQIGANFLLVGRIGSERYRTDADQRVTYFQVNLEMINLETAEVVWIQTEEVRKLASAR